MNQHTGQCVETFEANLNPRYLDIFFFYILLILEEKLPGLKLILGGVD